MKALACTAPGPLADLTIAELPAPVPDPYQVLLRVSAAALNPLDVKLVTGGGPGDMPLAYPHVPGMDVAGTVVGVGSGVTGYRAGDDVVAFLPPPRSGGIAELAVATVGSCLAHRPAGLDAAVAAALPTAGLTAAAVLRAVGPDPGLVLLVGATGGIGTLLVQLLTDAGARVLATAGPADAGLLRKLGATATVDHTATEVHPTGVDVAIDLVHAGADLATTARALRDGGRLLSLLGGPARLDGVLPEYLHLEAPDGELPRLLDLVGSGRLHVEVSTVTPFASAPSALRVFATGHTVGKHVIKF